MPEYSGTTITPADSVQLPAMNGSTSGNFILSALRTYILASKGQANGLASLDANGKLSAAQIPDLADDVIVVASVSNLPASGVAGKLYIEKEHKGGYIWDDALATPAFVKVFSGETESDLSDLISGLADGTVVPLKATQDSQGNPIHTTYETKADASDLKNALQDTEERLENVEQALSGTVITTNTDSTQKNVKTITSPNSILPYALLNRVGARSVAWNQLMNDFAYNSSVSKSGSTVTVTWNNSAGDTKFGVISQPITAGHVALVSVEIVSISVQNFTKIRFGNGLNTQTSIGKHTFIATPNSNSIALFVDASSFVSGDSFVYKDFNIFDLTAMNEASLTADQFRAKYPASYYPYNAGGIIDVPPTSFLIRGKNLFDQEWELGSLDLSTGEEVPSSNVIRSSNFIRVEPSQTYFFKFPNQTSLLYFYDASKNFLGYYGGFNGNLSYQIPSNCYYLRFITASTTYNNDIQICLNSYSDKNTFHDYVSATIDTSFMANTKYINPSCYDYSENVIVNGEKKRREHIVVKSVNLSEKTYSTDAYGHKYVLIPDIKRPADNWTAIAILHPVYRSIAYGTYVSSTDETACSVDTSGGLHFVTDNPTGILYYALATGDVHTYDDFIPNFPCEDGTTITAITPQTELVNAIDVPSTIAYMTKAS